MASTKLYGPAPAPGLQGTFPALNTPGAVAPGPLPASQTILVNTEVVIANPALSTIALYVPIPANSPLEQKRFQLMASGIMTLGTSSTATIKLYSGSSLTPGSNTLLKSSGAASAFSGTAAWWIDAKLIFDSTSGKLAGEVEFFINNVIVASAAIANQPTGISNTNNPVTTFCLSFTFGTAGTQVVVVQDFSVNF
jgi:hypothetical protein